MKRKTSIKSKRKQERKPTKRRHFEFVIPKGCRVTQFKIHSFDSW